MADTTIAESLSLTMDFEYTEGPFGVTAGFFIPQSIDITGTLDLEFNSSHQLTGVSDVDVTISGGGLPTEILTEGKVDTSYVNGQLVIDEVDLYCGHAVDGNPSDAVYTNLYLDFPAPNGSVGFEDSYNYPEPYTHLATEYATYYDSSSDPDGSLSPTTSCFTAGTKIRTPAGDVAVETLKIGDLVTLSDGGAAPVTWLGIRAVATRFADKLRVLPVRIKANALGNGLPARDMLISPDHALLVDGVLVNAGALVNGVSILRESDMPETFMYYHVEVAKHSLIVVEGVAAETFIDNVDRMSFDNWAEHQALYGDMPGIIEMAMPRVKSARQLPPATRKRLLARAQALYGAAIAA